LKPGKHQVPSIKAIETDVGPALADFSAHLWTLRVPHRIFDTGDGRQVLVVGTEAHAQLAREHFRRWVDGSLPSSVPGNESAVSEVQMWQSLRSSPVTFVTLLLSLLGTLVVYSDQSLSVLHWLTFTDVNRIAGRIVVGDALASYARGEYWRLVTPVFLHFGLLHCVFNMLWTWELGRRLEAARGSVSFLALLLLAGGGGNIAQFLADRGAIFGGMSGVIYGLLGYLWAWSRLTGDPRTSLPRGLLGFMLGWLLICMSGLVEALGFGAIANAAHAVGLLVGLALGAGAALLYSPPTSGRS
jgi:GlpG protein